jgi:ADP-ribosylglycohydrolase
METKKILAVLLGSAFGDACGWPVEFDTSPYKFYSKGLYLPLQKGKAIVTDDTQMMLRLTMALHEAHYTGEELQTKIKDQFIAWYKDPNNNRAPGNTCMAAISVLPYKPWYMASVTTSKGCGANMRVQPIGCLDPYLFSDKEMYDLACLQAAFTHGHPTALVASGLTAKAIRLLLEGCTKENLVQQLIAWLSLYKGYYPACLRDLYDYADYKDSTSYMEVGFKECHAMLLRVQKHLNNPCLDVCDVVGQGWVAEEALACALLSFVWSHDGEEAILRGCTTSGDSDSIACLAGALSGAYWGMATWSTTWVDKIEYREDLFKGAVALAKVDKLFY